MHHAENTCRFLQQHTAQYPSLQTEDCLKALYQSAFGCEHLVADPSAAAAYIRKEAERCVPHTGDVVEPLDGAFCRVHLDILNQGLSAETFARLFALSADPQQSGLELLEAKLDVMTDMAKNGQLPFSSEEVSCKIARWRQAGFPACHHSEAFRAAYAPAYRLMKRDYARFLPLFIRIDRLLQQTDRILLAIDGNSAAGKSTLAELLHAVYDCPVFHMDDFFLRPEQRTPERYAEPGGNVDRERFLAEVLEPMRTASAVAYRRFDCQTFTLLPAVPVTPHRLNIIEGSYSMHPDLASHYDLSVFLHISPETQKRRILTRNGAMAERFLTMWVPMENTYFDAFSIPQSCQFFFETD